jgi:hypothetical protein
LVIGNSSSFLPRIAEINAQRARVFQLAHLHLREPVCAEETQPDHLNNQSGAACSPQVPVHTPEGLQGSGDIDIEPCKEDEPKPLDHSFSYSDFNQDGAPSE